MRKGIVLMLIALLVGMFLVSCDSGVAGVDKVGTVELSIESAKGVFANMTGELEDVDNLYWFYTATKSGTTGFRTGETSTMQPLLTKGGSPIKGFPTVIGMHFDSDGDLEECDKFSWGNWTFTFYAFAANTTEENHTGKTAPTAGAGCYYYTAGTAVEIKSEESYTEITLKLGDAVPAPVIGIGTAGITFVSSTAVASDDTSPYTLYVTEGENSVATIKGTQDGTKVVKFAKTDFKNQIAGIHNYKFQVKKGTDGFTYAEDSITVNIEPATTTSLAGLLDNLDSLGIVIIDDYNIESTDKIIYIRDEYDLLDLATAVNIGKKTYEGYSFFLMNDLDLSEIDEDFYWTPIGNSYRGQENGAYFAGSFYGCGHTISGLEYVSNLALAKDNNGEAVFGLFGVVKNATIKDLILDYVDIELYPTDKMTGENVGALIGYSEGNLTVDNVTVNGYVYASNVGGLIGRAYAGENCTISIANCENNAEVIAYNGSDNKAKAAGIVGFLNTNGGNATITGCWNNGDIKSAATTHVIASGIANYGFQANKGKNETITISNNTNCGEIVINNSKTPTRSIDQIAALCAYKNTDDTFTATGNAEYGSAKTIPVTTATFKVFSTSDSKYEIHDKEDKKAESVEISVVGEDISWDDIVSYYDDFDFSLVKGETKLENLEFDDYYINSEVATVERYGYSSLVFLEGVYLYTSSRGVCRIAYSDETSPSSYDNLKYVTTIDEFVDGETYYLVFDAPKTITLSLEYADDRVFSYDFIDETTTSETIVIETTANTWEELFGKDGLSLGKNLSRKVDNETPVTFSSLKLTKNGDYGAIYGIQTEEPENTGLYVHMINGNKPLYYEPIDGGIYYLSGFTQEVIPTDVSPRV